MTYIILIALIFLFPRLARIAFALGIGYVAIWTIIMLGVIYYV